MLWFAAIRPGIQKRSSHNGLSNWKTSVFATTFWVTIPSCWTANISASIRIVQLPSVYLLWLTNWDTHCLTGSMPAPVRHFKTPIFIVWTTPRQKDEQISSLPNCFYQTMIFLNRLAITNSMPTGFIWRRICHPTHLQLTGQWNIRNFCRNSCIHTVMYSPRLRLPRKSKLKNTS